jgi:hypothetical protein
MGLLEKDKRKFRVIIGSKKCGMCYGTSPSLAAKKVKEKSGAFYLKEITKDSKKKLYGPYSSKKGVVQLGGELIKQLCKILIDFFLICPTFKKNKIDDDNKSIENAFRLLNINVFDSDRYTKLKTLIFLRNQYDKAIPFCELLCSVSPEVSEDQIENELEFIIKYRESIGMSQLSIVNWIEFIMYFKKYLKNMERRNNICFDIIELLTQCDKSQPSHLHDLLQDLYNILLINTKPNRCDILKRIIQLRENYYNENPEQRPKFLDILYSTGEHFIRESFFIDAKYNSLTILLDISNKALINRAWINFIKKIREKIKSVEKELIDGEKAREEIYRKNLEKMKQNLQNAKNRENQIKRNKTRQTQENLNRISRELEEANELFLENNPVILNNGNSGLPPLFLLSSRRNNRNRPTPSYLLISTKNNQINRGFATAGPAEEKTNNSNIGKHKGKPSYLLTNNELAELGINPNGSSAANLPTNLSQIPKHMLQPVRRQLNVKPVQPSHNNQQPAQGQPALTNSNEAENQRRHEAENQRRHENLLRQLQAALNNNNQKPAQGQPAPIRNLQAELAALLIND